jgi:hypothetical protein
MRVDLDALVSAGEPEFDLDAILSNRTAGAAA